ncbi:MAG TPA: antitoxin Xre/MbcA/ParS toxin-binding domain-containing protein [Rhodanobacteraceae bacterium]|nr:antitoxin Xre/MbcA/ParS toxin-binding domain-containing protein [Rhodanobacteraceae bacterium]
MQTLAERSTLRFLKLKPATREIRDEAMPAHGTLVAIDPLPIGAIELLSQYLGLPGSEVAKLAGIPARTYQRRKEHQQPLTASESDATLRIARIVQAADRVFGDASRAIRWMTSRHALLGESPIRLLGSDAGAQAVQDELTRIQWGDYA